MKTHPPRLGFRWRAGLILAALLVLAAAGQAAAPSIQVVHSGISAETAIFLGAPFQVILEVDAPGAQSWSVGFVPRRCGIFTLRRFDAQPEEGPVAGRWLLRFQWQVFRLGELPVPQVPVVCTLEDGTVIPLAPPALKVQVKERLSAEGPLPVKPSRGGFALPRFIPWWWIGAAALGLALLAFPLARKMRRPPPESEAKSFVPTLEYFFERINAIVQGTLVKNQRLRAKALMDVFRSYLEWRFGTDLSASTGEEVLRTVESALRDAEGWNPAELGQLLSSAELVCFGPDSGQIKDLVDGVRSMIERLGAPASPEEGTVGPLPVAS